MPDQPDMPAVAPTMAPEAVRNAEASALARFGDPSLPPSRTDPKQSRSSRPGGLEWVRASDLLARIGTGLGDRAFGGHDRIVARMRAARVRSTAVSRSGISRASAPTAPRLAPPSVFGQPPLTPPAGPGQVVTP